MKFKSVLEAAEDFNKHVKGLNVGKNFTVGVDNKTIYVYAEEEIYCPVIYDGYPVCITVIGKFIPADD